MDIENYIWFPENKLYIPSVMVQDTMMFPYLDTVCIGRRPSVNLRFKDKAIEDWCRNNFDIWDLRAEYLSLKPYERNRYVNVALLYCPDEQLKMLFKLFWMDGKTDFLHLLKY